VDRVRPEGRPEHAGAPTGAGSRRVLAIAALTAVCSGAVVTAWQAPTTFGRGTAVASVAGARSLAGKSTPGSASSPLGIAERFVAELVDAAGLLALALDGGSALDAVAAPHRPTGLRLPPVTLASPAPAPWDGSPPPAHTPEPRHSDLPPPASA